MHPTLKEDDLLEVVPYDKRNPRKGDVILFQANGLSRPVIHRIVAARNTRYLTRGDNCSGTDPWETTRQQIIGRITSAVRGSRTISISGGRTGTFRSYWCRFYNGLGQVSAGSLNQGLTTIMACLPQKAVPFPEKKLRVVRFQTSRTSSYRLLLGTKYIGYYDTAAAQWQIRFPFCFLIRRASLPKI